MVPPSARWRRLAWGRGRRAAPRRRCGTATLLLRAAAAVALVAGAAAATSRPTAAASEALVSLPGPDGATLRAVLVLPDAGRPGVPVIALHGCAGLGGPGGPPRLPARERDWAVRLAALGHPVLLPDSFGSRGVAEVCRGPEGALRPEAVRRADAHAAAAWAAAQPWAAGPARGAFLLGWSHGGSTALAAAGAPLPPGLVLRGAVAFYPGCRRPGQPAPAWEPSVPVLMLLGGADEWTPSAPCREAAARAGPARVVAVTYPGAHHGFDQPGMPVGELTGLAMAPGGRARMGTDPAARDDARARVPAFLAAHGGAAGQD